MIDNNWVIYTFSNVLRGLRSTEEALFLPTQKPRVQIPAPLRDFISLLLRLCAKQRISQIQLAMALQTNYYLQKYLLLEAQKQNHGITFALLLGY